MGAEWAWGVVLAVTGALITTVGWALQKYVHHRAQRDAVELHTFSGHWVPRDPNAKYDRTARRVHRLMLPVLAGVVGAQSVMFAKMSMELVKSTFVHGRYEQLSSVLTYVAPTLAITTVLLEVMWVNQGLEQFSPYVIVPVFTVRARAPARPPVSPLRLCPVRVDLLLRRGRRRVL